MTRNGHRSDWLFGKRRNVTDNLRNPPSRYRVVLVGLVYGTTGAVAGALAGVAVGWPVSCMVAGALVGAMLGARIEAT
jgi:hypothetical protein